MTPRWSVVAILLLAAGVSAGAQVQRDRPSAPRDKPAVPTGSAVIAGMVVSADDRQQPVRRASVMLASGQIAIPRTAVTDDEGRFMFTALAPGNYTLVGQKAAWVPSVYGARSSTDTQGVPIAVTDGQRVDGLRLLMMRGAVVTGTVRLPGGQPAVGLSVQALRAGLVDGRRQLATVAGPAETNDLGEYRVFGLAPGDYVMQARSPLAMAGGGVARQVSDAEVRWADQRLAQAQDPMQASVAPPPQPAPGPAVTYSAVYFPGTTIASDATVVSVRAGEERGSVDFTLSVVPTARVTGTVIGTDGAPSAGAVVQLEPEANVSGDLMSTLLGMMGGSGRTTTGQDGTFALSGVTPGRYTLSARATPRRPGAAAPSPAEARVAEAMAMAVAMGGLLGGAAENPATLWAAEPVAVNGQDLGPLGLALRDGLTIEGSVVVEGGGVPPDVATLRIAVAKPSSGDAATAMFTRAMNASTGLPKEDGTFTVRGLVPGRYQLSVTGKAMRVNTMIPGMLPAETGWVVKSIRWREQELADSGLEMQADMPVSGVVVTLTDRPTQLGGTVIDTEGRPTGAFPIVVFSTDRAQWEHGSRRVLQAQPASDGRFSVIGLPAGDYYVAAVTRLEPGDLSNRRFLEELLPASLRITIRDGEKKTQDLKLSGGS